MIYSLQHIFHMISFVVMYFIQSWSHDSRHTKYAVVKYNQRVSKTEDREVRNCNPKTVH